MQVATVYMKRNVAHTIAGTSKSTSECPRRDTYCWEETSTSEIPKREIKEDLKSYEKKLLPERESNDSDESEMITQLKDKFETATKRSDKVLVLTVLPKSRAIRKVQEEFGVSNYMDGIQS